MPEAGEVFPGESSKIGNGVDRPGGVRSERRENAPDARQDGFNPSVREGRCDPSRDFAIFRPVERRGKADGVGLRARPGVRAGEPVETGGEEELAQGEV